MKTVSLGGGGGKIKLNQQKGREQGKRTCKSGPKWSVNWGGTFLSECLGVQRKTRGGAGKGFGKKLVRRTSGERVSNGRDM